MNSLAIYDPPMCCSTGVCGPKVDPALVRFAADVKWLADQRVQVTRFNLSQDPAAFVGNTDVTAALEGTGEKALPVIVANGKVIANGRYPRRDELCKALGLIDTTLPKLSLATPSDGCCGGGKC